MSDHVPKVFISYHRQAEEMAKFVVDDLRALGYDVWLDQHLSGGQAWWDEILESIRDCDLFVFLLDPRALDSAACQREFGYAAALGKSILPLLTADKVSTKRLPPELSRLQCVNYGKQDRYSALRLARALLSLPPSKPLPNPLPPPPGEPVSDLGSLAQKIDTASRLSYEEQSALVMDLERSLQKPEATGDTRDLLQELRDRRDCYLRIAEQIDALLATPAQAPSGATKLARFTATLNLIPFGVLLVVLVVGAAAALASSLFTKAGWVGLAAIAANVAVAGGIGALVIFLPMTGIVFLKAYWKGF